MTQRVPSQANQPATARSSTVWLAFLVALFTSTLGFIGCSTSVNRSGLAPVPDSVLRQLTLNGIKALEENRPVDASRSFNAALKLDVQNSYLHFLNGLAYHLSALRDDRSQFALAEQGYRQAIQFDDTNWLARYYLGLVYLDQRQYAQAKIMLADAMLYNDSDLDLLYDLAAAAYYARDPVTAAGVLTRLNEVAPDTPRVLHASSMVLAALDHPAAAERFLERYKSLEPSRDLSSRLARRLNDWKRFHELVRTSRVEAPTSLAQAQSPLEEAPGTSPTEAAAESTQAATEDPSKKMIIVDVVIIGTEEDITTAKGVNLLDGLKVQFGAPDAGAFTRAFREVRSTDPSAQVTTTTITRALTIPAITYSLNIANAGSTRNEILARPTLIALSGQKSEFFSGTNVRAAAVSQTAQLGSVEVNQDIGVKLAITPEFSEGSRVKLLVEAERTFLQTPSESVQFTFQIRTSKTSVNANILMNPGETLILSGLSEKETEHIRRGVPLLQEVPAIQYFFSTQRTRDFNRSVLVLITPRTPEYVYRPEPAKADARTGATEAERVVDELKARYSDWFRPYPNWASVFHHLQANSLYREFRTGDVSLERWETQNTWRNRLKAAVQFLHY